MEGSWGISIGASFSREYFHIYIFPSGSIMDEDLTPGAGISGAEEAWICMNEV